MASRTRAYLVPFSTKALEARLNASGYPDGMLSDCVSWFLSTNDDDDDLSERFGGGGTA